jgi:hypothetical protein
MLVGIAKGTVAPHASFPAAGGQQFGSARSAEIRMRFAKQSRQLASRPLAFPHPRIAAERGSVARLHPVRSNREPAVHRKSFASRTLVAVLSLVSALAAQSSWPLGSAPSGVHTQVDENGFRATAIEGYEASAHSMAQAPLPANWQGLGPFGGDISDVQVSPVNSSVVLAALAPASGAAGTLYRSTDAGSSWAPVASLANVACYDIDFAPDGTAYVSTIDGVWKSTNNGSSFNALNLGIGLNDQTLALTIDPTNPLRLWCGVADAIGNQPVNVMLSVNGGTSWSNKTPPLPSPMSCTGIAVNPGDNQKVYACFGGAFGGGQVWVSSNGGTSWTNKSSGLPANPMQDIVHEGTRLLVAGGQAFGSQFVGLYSSTSEGTSWTPLHDGTWPTLVINDIAIDPNNSAVMLLGSGGKGVFRSINGGASWSFGVGGTGPLTVNSVSFAPGSSTTVFLGNSSNAVWKSTAPTPAFAPSSTGIGALDVFAVGSNPRDEREIAIAFQGQNDGGVYSSTDGGASWKLEALPGTRYSSVRFTPAGQLYAISSGPSSVAPEGLYRRDGSTWTGIGPNQGALYESDLFTMRFSANSPGLIWAAGADFGVAGHEATVWRTLNGGGLWTKTYEGPAAPFDVVHDLHVVDPAADTTLLAAFTEGGATGGVLRSTTGGASWVPSGAGLSPTAQCSTLSSSAANPGAIYVSNSEAFNKPAVYRSTDGGQSWTPTGALGQAGAVAADQHLSGTLYISQFSGAKVAVSIDDGASFSPYDTGLASAGFLRDLRPSLGSAATILAAASTGSYATNVGFAPTWLDFGLGLAGTSGVPLLDGDGLLVTGTPVSIALSNARPSSVASLFVSLNFAPTPFKGGTLVTVPVDLTFVLITSPSGTLQLSAAWPSGVPSGTKVYLQCAVQDPVAVKGAAVSNALQAQTP